MKKLALFIATLAAVPAMFAASAFADRPGQLSNGDNNYQVKNVNQNGAYGKSVNLACNETVKYSILFSNSDFGQLNNVTVKATMPNTITVSATNADNQPTSVSGTVAVSMPSNGTLSYIAGSTNYYVYKADGSVASTKTLADGVTAGGINTGTLAGSTTARVYFQAKVNCPTTPPEMCTVPGKENLPKNSPLCVVTPTTPSTPATPTELPQTGGTGLFAVVAAIVALGAGYLVTTRKTYLAK